MVVVAAAVGAIVGLVDAVRWWGGVRPRWDLLPQSHEAGYAVGAVFPFHQTYISRCLNQSAFKSSEYA
jgi:hypothetical protein